MATPKKLFGPRKLPSQTRSKIMVDTILEATARILVKKGFAGTTTNGVAELAGVSIGSLYQYFPSREALVVAIAQRHSNKLKTTLEDTLSKNSNMPLEDALYELMRAIDSAHAVDPDLNRVLADELPRLGKLDWKVESGRRGRAVVRTFLEMHKAEVRKGIDLETASFLITAFVEGSLNYAYRLGKEAPSRDLLIKEINEMILKYIRK